MEPLGAFRKSAPTVPASPAKEVPTPKPPSRKKVEKEDSRKASKPKVKVLDGGDGGDGGDDEEPKKKKRKAVRPPKPAGASEPTDTWRTSVKRENVKTGKWSADEQRQLTAAIKAYAVAHDQNPVRIVRPYIYTIAPAHSHALTYALTHAQGDLDWLIGKKHSHEEGRGMWKEICAALPNRSIKAVAAAALRLHHPYAGAGQFTQDEDDALRGLVLNHGNKWTDFSPILKRTPEACRLRWRDIKNVETRSTGKWSELEEQQLKDAVTKYGNPSSHKGDGSDKRLLLDNIDWEAVLPHVPTRTRTQCVAKWYLRLAPSMCERGIWAKGDDKRLMTSLFKLRKQQPAGKQWHESAVPWDSLVQDRTGDECKRRWAFMKKNVPDANNKDLAQIVLELVNSNFRSLLQK